MKEKFAPAFMNGFLTQFYDRFVDLALVGTVLQKKTLVVLGSLNEKKILDIGCGTGTLVNLIKLNYPTAIVTGLDIDNQILKIAKKKAIKNNLSINFVQSSAEKLPFANFSFDIIISSLAFHHLPTNVKKIALKEIYRILKPHGKFFLIDIGKPENFFWKVVLQLESLVEPKAYLQDNLEGKLPIFAEDSGFKIKFVRKPYMGIHYLLATKS